MIFGIAEVDLGGVLAGEPQHRAIASGLQRVAGRHFAARNLAEVSHAGIGQRDHRFLNVVDGPAPPHAARAGGVVRDHAAYGGAARGGNVGRKTQAERRQLRIQFIQHDAGFHADPPLVRIHFQHAVVVFRNVDLQAGPDRLAALRRAAAAHGDGAAVTPANLQAAQNVLAIPGNDHAHRLNLVDAGIGGIERARNRIEADLAFDLALQLPAERAVVQHGAAPAAPAGMPATLPAAWI